MNASKSDTIFQNLRFVLVQTSHPGNVGAAARAIKTMGFSRLVLVSPRYATVKTHPEAIAFASGALDVLENTRIVDRIDDALDGCVGAAAVTARLREFSAKILTPRQFAETQLRDDPVPRALVFGSERYGLPNDIVSRCDTVINIPASEQHTSLNLAQAVQVLAYECRMALLAGKGNPETKSHIGFKGTPATVDQVNGMLSHMERALIALGYLDPGTPKKLMPRLSRLFSRSRLETEEINILRGIANQIEELAGKTKG